MQYSKIIIIVGLFVSVMSCKKEVTLQIVSPKNNIKAYDTVLKTLTVLNSKKGLVYYDAKPFTGHTVIFYSATNLAESIEYTNGIKNGFYKKWFKNGDLSFESYYKNGKQDGITKSWWINGFLRSESNYQKGISQGKQYQFYSSGEKFKERHLINGKEEGLQKGWRKNGKLYINYEAKNGRTFGLKRANMCYELQKEQLLAN